MKIEEYIKNPAGKGAIIPGRNLLLSNYDYRFQVLSKEKSISLNIYIDKEVVYYHMLIPTESENRNNIYDVVLKFKPVDQSSLIDKTYRQYDIEFFSNCPSFTYTYAYVAKLNGYLLSELEGKYDEKIISIPPTSRNPGLIFGYEKSIYFACKHLLSDRQLLVKSYVKTHGRKLTKNVLKRIRTVSQIEEDIMREKNKYRESKKTITRSNKKDDKKVKSFNKKETVSGVRKIEKKQSAKNKVNTVKPIKKRR